MVDKEIRIAVVVDSDGAVTKLKNLDSSVKESGDSVEQSAKGFSKFQANLITLNSTLDLAGKGFSLLRSSVGTLFEALDRAGTVEGLQRSFDNLQASIGSLGSEKIAGLQNATKGLVSDFDLLQQANQAVLL